jgi:hypothetical protein
LRFRQKILTPQGSITDALQEKSLTKPPPISLPGRLASARPRARLSGLSILATTQLSAPSVQSS